MELTVGKLGAKYNLSRSTLLYYDKIGLLKPSFHIQGEYRHYTAADEQRLIKICHYRKAGIQLKEIKVLLDSPETSFTAILNKRFGELNDEIQKLYQQQRIIAGLLKNCGKLNESGVMTKELWTSLLETSGFTDKDMYEWHVAFERTAPDKHQLFLEYLQIPDDEIAVIRGWATDPVSYSNQ